jgi:hypothetical protein
MPPGASKGIGDNHCYIEPKALTQSLPNRPCRRIGVWREYGHYLCALDIRLIDAGIGTNKAVMRFGNKNPTVHFDNAARLLQHDLDMARIFPPLPRETFSERRGRDVLEDNEMALCLGHHLLGDHQNISRLQRQ